MGEATKIEWCDATWNPWIGCTKVHEGCANCYAERDFDKRRHVAKWGPSGTRVVTSEANWKQPEKWDREAHKASVRRRVFCASLADVFEESALPLVYAQKLIDGDRISPAVWYGPKKVNGKIIDDVLDAGQMLRGCGFGKQYRRAGLADVRRRLFSLIDATPNLDWLLLTKRPENISRMWTLPANGRDPVDPLYIRRDNVWLGTSISKQEHADQQIPELLKCRDLAPVLFLSIEPMLGPLDISQRLKMIDWVIVGGESGPNARPMHPDWVRSVRDQCQAAGVPFFFKQFGEWSCDFSPPVVEGDIWMRDTGEFERVGKHPETWSGELDPGHGGEFLRPVGKKAAGRLLDGREWSELPSGGA